MMPESVEKIIRRLRNAGFPAYAVGGCVRDSLLGRAPRDWDVATAASAGDIQSLFERTVPTGIKYGSVTVLTDGGSVDVTTFRRDGAYRDARRPETVEFVSDLRDDLSRRDFTVNAMAMDENGAITDLFGGRDDLTNRLIRCVGDPSVRFAEDALRMLRAVRFSAQLGFTIEPDALAALKRLAPACEKLSAERTLSELEKTLASDPVKAGDMMGWGLLKKFISPDAAALPLERLAGIPADLRLPALAVMTSAAGYSAAPGDLLRSLRCPAKTVRLAAGAEAVFTDLAPSPDAAAIRLALSGHDPNHVLAASAALGAYDRAAKELASKRFARPRDLAVTGADAAGLGFEGGEISDALRTLARAVTRGETENRREDLLRALERMR